MPLQDIFQEQQLPFEPSFFPSDYHASRERFLQTVKMLDASIDSHPVATRTAALQNSLFIDIATIGNPDARKRILVVAGTHGVEGFMGSAIQYALLKRLKSPPDSFAITLVHCLNPWGMAMSRRCNENNVDLNRNCLFNPEERTGAPVGYELARDLVLPDATTNFRVFAFSALLKIVQHGYSTMVQAVTGGQYVDPQGLYYGGSELQPELEIFKTWVLEHLSHAEHIFRIDLHSGLGGFCKDTILLDALKESAEYKRIVALFGSELVHAPDSVKSLTFNTRGSLSHLIPAVHPDALVDQLVHEFGTLHPFKVLHALVNENRLYHEDPENRAAPPVKALQEAFCPSSITWRMNVVRRGFELFRDAVRAF